MTGRPSGRCRLVPLGATIAEKVTASVPSHSKMAIYMGAIQERTSRTNERTTSKHDYHNYHNFS